MRVEELNREQLIQVKIKYLINKKGSKNLSYGEIAGADTFVKDSVIFEEFRNVNFTSEDFI